MDRRGDSGEVEPAVTRALIVMLPFCVLAGLLWLGGAYSCAEPAADPPRPTTQALADWPMYRGGPELLGLAQGRLAQELKLLWRFKTEGAVKSSPAVVGGRVFVGSDDNRLYAIDLASGRKLWSHATEGGVEASPLVLNGTVFVGSSDETLYALGAAAGTLKWKYKTGDRILGAANWTKSPDGRAAWVLVGSYDNKLHCVDAATGKLVWTYQTENYVNGAPAVAGGKVVFGGCDAVVHVVSAADGRKLATVETGAYIAGSAALDGKRAYVGNYGGKFLCADMAAGGIVWSYGDGKTPFFSSPAVAADRVLIGSRDKSLHCVARETGRPLWSFQTLGKVDSSPVVCGDKVVVGSDDGRLYLLRLSDGAKLWSYEIGQPIGGSPAVAAGRVIVGADDGYVYAFGGSAQ